MNFSKSLDAWNTRQFADVFTEDLCDHQYNLPLQHFCSSGGIPDDDADYDITDMSETKDAIIIEVQVSFREMVSTSCADISFPEDCRGTLTIEIKKSTGEATAIPESGYHPRNLEYY